MRLPNLRLVVVISAMVASVLAAVPAAGAQDAQVQCDPDFVTVDVRVVTVHPTGVDDTENLQCALDLAASMPTAHVRLLAGDYATSFLDVEGFRGSLRGAGMHDTTVSTLRGGLDCISRVEQIDGYPDLLTFIASRVTLAGMTFAIDGDAPCAEPWASEVDDEGFGFVERSIGGIFSTTSIGPFDGTCPGIVDHRLRVFDVAFESDFPDLDEMIIDWANFGNGVAVDMIEPSDTCTDTRLRGDVIVRGSAFSGHSAAVVVIATQDSRVLVGGRQPWQSNVIEEVGFGVVMVDANGNRARVVGNEITPHWWGVLGIGELYSSQSSMNVARNRITAIDTADGIGIVDFGPEIHGEPVIDATIKKNTIELVETPFNGIFLLGGDDGRVTGNRIYGVGATGIWLEGLQFFDEETEEAEIIHYSSGWYIANNELSGLDPYFVDVFLHESTTENTVMCKHPSDEVVDDGIDNGIIGCALLALPELTTSAVESTASRPGIRDKAVHPYAWVQQRY